MTFIGHRNHFLDMSLQVREIKAKLNYWYNSKVKSFCTTKETVSKTKRQSTEWEKIIARNVGSYTTQHLKTPNHLIKNEQRI